MSCACTFDNISTPAEVQCKPCKTKGPDTEASKSWLEAPHSTEWKCYHHEFRDNTFVQKCQASMDELIEEHKVEMEAVKDSKLKKITDSRNQQSASSDKTSICIDHRNVRRKL
jgi:hypothetical protein